MDGPDPLADSQYPLHEMMVDGPTDRETDFGATGSALEDPKARSAKHKDRWVKANGQEDVMQFSVAAIEIEP